MSRETAGAAALAEQRGRSHVPEWPARESSCQGKWPQGEQRGGVACGKPGE